MFMRTNHVVVAHISNSRARRARSSFEGCDLRSYSVCSVCIWSGLNLRLANGITGLIAQFMELDWLRERDKRPVESVI